MAHHPEHLAAAWNTAKVMRGVEYLFGNAGRDFASIIDGFARAAILGLPAPNPVTVPHEVPAVAMAYGYYMITGQSQAVMVHVIVGSAVPADRPRSQPLCAAPASAASPISTTLAPQRHHGAVAAFEQGLRVLPTSKYIPRIMANEKDMWNSARFLIDTYGDQAADEAAFRDEAMLAEGSVRRQRLCLRIEQAVVEMQRVEPGEDEQVH